jgi:hypothetical protein
MRPDNKSRPLITCQDEAFTVLVVENARQYLTYKSYIRNDFLLLPTQPE